MGKLHDDDSSAMLFWPQRPPKTFEGTNVTGSWCCIMRCAYHWVSLWYIPIVCDERVSDRSIHILGLNLPMVSKRFLLQATTPKSTEKRILEHDLGSTTFNSLARVWSFRIKHYNLIQSGNRLRSIFGSKFEVPVKHIAFRGSAACTIHWAKSYNVAILLSTVRSVIQTLCTKCTTKPASHIRRTPRAEESKCWRNVVYNVPEDPEVLANVY